MNVLLASALLASLAGAGDGGAEASGSKGAPSFSVEWHTLDSGGGTSADRSFALCGSLGAVEAEPLQPASGDGYALVSGFMVGTSRCGPVDVLFADSFE